MERCRPSHPEYSHRPWLSLRMACVVGSWKHLSLIDSPFLTRGAGPGERVQCARHVVCCVTATLQAVCIPAEVSPGSGKQPQSSALEGSQVSLNSFIRLGWPFIKIPSMESVCLLMMQENVTIMVTDGNGFSLY